MGHLAMIETITSGRPIDQHINELAKTIADESFYGALECLISTYVAIRAAGLVPPFEDKDLDKFMHAGVNTMCLTINQQCAAWNSKWLNVHIAAMIQVINTNRDKISFSRPVAQAAPVPEPLPVRVIGLPDRVTDTKVTYDASGNIASTAQTEKDVV
jgi:hypothetical protein